LAASVPASLRGEKRLAKEAELLKLYRDFLRSGVTGSPKWKTTYWKAGKRRLKSDSEGKCAYCESPTDVVAHGDVEHFRPKSIYWWLVYCFDNHLFVCQICNQSYKGDNFPLSPHAATMTGPSVAATTTDAQLAVLVGTFAPDPVDIGTGFTHAKFLASCNGEHAGLPDPYNDNPERYFRWEADETNKEVWLRPRTNSARHKFVVKSCEDYFGLNREELRRWRWTLTYNHLATLRAILSDLDRQNVTGAARTKTEDAIREMMADGKPYAGMVRYFVRTLWRLPV
jgi:hypothetical protein